MSDDPIDARPDEALVHAVLHAKDERAFRILYRRHTSALYASAMRLLGEPADAADAVQDTWVRAVTRLPEFAWRSSLRTWLNGILLNRSREMLRERARESQLDGETGDAIASNSPPALADSIDINGALRALSSGYRTVFVLHDVEGFTHKEIGDFLGIDAGTSKSQLSRARQVLRRLLGANGERQ